MTAIEKIEMINIKSDKWVVAETYVNWVSPNLPEDLKSYHPRAKGSNGPAAFKVKTERLPNGNLKVKVNYGPTGISWEEDTAAILDAAEFQEVDGNPDRLCAKGVNICDALKDSNGKGRALNGVYVMVDINLAYNDLKNFKEFTTQLIWYKGCCPDESGEQVLSQEGNIRTAYTWRN